MTLSSSIFRIVGVVLVLGFLYGMYSLWIGSGEVKSEETFSEEYELVFKDYNGNDVRLSSFQHVPLVVFTYASWCLFCGDELERLSRIQEEYQDRLTVVAVNRAESLAEAKSFTDTLMGVGNILYLLDPDDAYFKSVNGYAMPETVFIQSYGKIFTQHRGPLSDDALRAYIEDMLPQ